MQLRRLGTTGQNVSSISLGVMNFGSGTGEEAAAAILFRALDAGVTLVDTANIYHSGESERVVGRLLDAAGRRDEVLLATKCGLPMGPGPDEQGAGRRHIIQACEDSLRRLRTDHIDLYQLHRPFFDIDPEETLGAFDELRRSGKVLHTGSSTHPAWFLLECLHTSRDHGWEGYISDQSPYNLLDRRAENELLPMCRRHSISVLPWSPIAAGILAGRYDSTEPPPDSRASRLPALRRRITPAALEAAGKLAALAGETGMLPAELALVWLRDRPGVTSPIVGPRTLQQLETYLSAAERPSLDDDLVDRIDEIVPPGQFVSDFYNSSGWLGASSRPNPLRTA
jgi:aryl-alcohol dehydrogenase-like predicted oxidoreductase